MPPNRGSSTLVFVKVQGYSALRYTFLTLLRSAARTKLGQTTITSQIADISGIALSPQSPKPARAAGKLETRTLSGYCDRDKITELRGEGFTLTQPKISEPRGPLSRLLYVNINGLKYAWSRAKELGQEVDATLLGVQEASANEAQLIVTPDFPIPPQVAIAHPDGGQTRYYVEPNNIDTAIENGWSKVGSGKYTLAALRAMATVES